MATGTGAQPKHVDHGLVTDMPDARPNLQVVSEDDDRSAEELIPALQLAFARLHKAAFGVATGKVL